MLIQIYACKGIGLSLILKQSHDADLPTYAVC